MEHKEEKKKSKIGYIIIGVILVIGMIIAGTFAYYTWISNVNKMVAINTAPGLEEYIIYEEGASVFSGSWEVSSDYTGGKSTTFSIGKTASASKMNLVAYINMEVKEIGTNIAASSAVKWAITSGDTLLSEGNFNGKAVDDNITLLSDITLSTTLQTYTVWLWIDEAENPSTELTGEILDVNIFVDVNLIPVMNVTLFSNYSLDGGTELTGYRQNTNYGISSSAVVGFEYPIPAASDYMIRLWGASGGRPGWHGSYSYAGGYGGYTQGIKYISPYNGNPVTLYAKIGAYGMYSSFPCSGATSGEYAATGSSYNGGGSGYAYHLNCSGTMMVGAGGGATHVATVDGVLSSLSNNKNAVLAVAGGGGGGAYTSNGGALGGDGGGYEGIIGEAYAYNSLYGYGTGGGQSTVGSSNAYYSSNSYSKGSFGQGGSAYVVNSTGYYYGGGGGGGWYGGGGAFGHGEMAAGGGGGSGYIGGLDYSNNNVTYMSTWCRNTSVCKTQTSTTGSLTYTKKALTVDSQPLNGYAMGNNGGAAMISPTTGRTYDTDSDGVIDVYDYYPTTVYYKTESGSSKIFTFTGTKAYTGGTVSCDNGATASIDGAVVTVNVNNATLSNITCKVTNYPIMADAFLVYDAYTTGGVSYDDLSNPTSTHWDGTASGTINYTNGGWVFTGSQGIISNQATDLEGSFTVETYIEVTDDTSLFNPSSYMSLLANWQVGGFGLQLDGISSSFGIYDSDNGEYVYATGPTTISSGKKYLITGVFDYDSQTIKVYINGVAGNSVSWSGSLIGNVENSTRFAIGCDPNGSSCTDGYFAGTVYSARIYNRALSGEEIAVNYSIDKVKYG